MAAVSSSAKAESGRCGCGGSAVLTYEEVTCAGELITLARADEAEWVVVALWAVVLGPLPGSVRNCTCDNDCTPHLRHGRHGYDYIDDDYDAGVTVNQCCDDDGADVHARHDARTHYCDYCCRHGDYECCDCQG